MKREENHIQARREQGYNGREAVRALRASVDATSDREELRVMHSQLCQLAMQIRDKLKGRLKAR